MPLPVGHSLAGYIFYESFESNRRPISWKTVVLFALIANLPDLDFLPGFLLGEPHLYHRHFMSHSIGAAVVFGGLLALVFRLVNGKSFRTGFLVFTSVYFSHVFLDFLGADFSQPRGVPMLWPFSEQYFISPVSLFMSIEKTNTSGLFFQSLFVQHNFWVLMREVVIFTPLAAFLWIRRLRQDKRVAENRRVLELSLD